MTKIAINSTCTLQILLRAKINKLGPFDGPLAHDLFVIPWHMSPNYHLITFELDRGTSYKSVVIKQSKNVDNIVGTNWSQGMVDSKFDFITFWTTMCWNNPHNIWSISQWLLISTPRYIRIFFNPLPWLIWNILGTNFCTNTLYSSKEVWLKIRLSYDWFID